MRRSLLKSAVGMAAICGTAALAAEAITYRYDARGRLVKAEHSGAVNNNVNTSYRYDKADNRTNRTVTAPLRESGHPAIPCESRELRELCAPVPPHDPLLKRKGFRGQRE